MAPKRTASLGVSTIIERHAQGRSVLELRDGQVIFSQGDPADSVFYVKSGKVKITVTSARGKEAVVAIADRGHFFGEGTLIGGHPVRMATANAMGHSAVVRFTKDAMLRLLHDEPQFAELFMSYMVARTMRVEEDLIDQLFNSTEKRLARVLLLLANFGKEAQSQSVVPKIGQEPLAQMVGASRARVSSFLNKFRKLGFIDYNGGLHVNSSLLQLILHD